MYGFERRLGRFLNLLPSLLLTALQRDFVSREACNWGVAFLLLLTFGLGRLNPPIGTHWIVEIHGVCPGRTRHASWLTHYHRREPRGLCQLKHQTFLLV